MSIDDSRFPDIRLVKNTDSSPSVRAFGRRFYRDQTPLEYLAEFLLCFSAEKNTVGEAAYPGFPSFEALPHVELEYYPESRLALKLFSFFPSSKLETRHPVHVDRFKQLIGDITNSVEASSSEEAKRAVQALQKLFAGFVGVSGERTWATHSFVPASRYLLSREIDWRHSKALRENISDWRDAWKHFSTGSHNFMARGGEMLFLQIWHVLNLTDESEINEWLADRYSYINWRNVKDSLPVELDKLIHSIDAPLEKLGSVVESAAKNEPEIQEKKEPQKFGWVYRASWPEATLFAWEIANVVASSQDSLRKIRILQDLCCLHVLRSMCFQANRLVSGTTEAPSKHDFGGGYAWITVGPSSGLGTDLGKASNASVSAVEELLFKALRSDALPLLSTEEDPSTKLSEADQHGYKLFRGLAKQIGLVVPRNGPMRFTLSGALVETAVAALLSPSERIPYDEFLERLYFHFGIAAGNNQIDAAIKSLNLGIRLAPQNDCAAWLEDELKRGGLLIALSDATPLVENPA